MKYLLITLMLLLAFTGCQDKEHDTQKEKEHDTKIVAQIPSKVLVESEAKQSKEISVKEKVEVSETNISKKPMTKLNQIGIDMEHGTITIDTNKTKKFFNHLSEQMQVQMGKISHDIASSVDMNTQSIHIDLNQTQNLLQTWDKKIKNFVKEFDTVTQNTENNISKEK